MSDTDDKIFLIAARNILPLPSDLKQDPRVMCWGEAQVGSMMAVPKTIKHCVIDRKGLSRMQVLKIQGLVRKLGFEPKEVKDNAAIVKWYRQFVEEAAVKERAELASVEGSTAVKFVIVVGKRSQDDSDLAELVKPDGQILVAEQVHNSRAVIESSKAIVVISTEVDEMIRNALDTIAVDKKIPIHRADNRWDIQWFLDRIFGEPVAPNAGETVPLLDESKPPSIITPPEPTAEEILPPPEPPTEAEILVRLLETSVSVSAAAGELGVSLPAFAAKCRANHLEERLFELCSK